MVGDMSRVTFNYDLSNLYISSQGQDLYSYQKLNMYNCTFTGSHLRAVTDADDDDADADADNAGRHSTTTRATYRQ